MVNQNEETLEPTSKRQKKRQLDKVEKVKRKPNAALQGKKSTSNMGENYAGDLSKKGSGISEKNKNLNEPFPGYKEETIRQYREQYSKKRSKEARTSSTRTSSSKMVIGIDDRRPILETTRFPYQSICKLYIESLDGKMYGGTGAYIGPNSVLTAAHNVYNSDIGGWVKEITVIPGLSRRVEPFGSDRSNFFLCPKLYETTESQKYDFAAIITNRAYGNELGYFEVANFSQNELTNLLVTVVGYPKELPLEDVDQGRVQYYHTLGISEVIDDTIKYNIDTSKGQSGSPVLCLKNGTLHICGIHNTGSQNANLATPISGSVFETIELWKVSQPRS